MGTRRNRPTASLQTIESSNQVIEKVQPYNPLAKTNLGDSVAEALLRTRVRPISDTKGLVGAGVYALYYVGSLGAYAAVSARNVGGRFELPIYVGKAVPKGARKGGTNFDASSGTALRSRLKEHAKTIAQAPSLDVSDFHYRALTVDDIWIPLGENVLIERFRPLWNGALDGFGNKTPGQGRKTQKRSLWDVFHPGRSFVERLELAESKLTAAQIEEQIAAYCAKHFSN